MANLKLPQTIIEKFQFNANGITMTAADLKGGKFTPDHYEKFGGEVVKDLTTVSDEDIFSIAVVGELVKGNDKTVVQFSLGQLLGFKVSQNTKVIPMKKALEEVASDNLGLEREFTIKTVTDSFILGYDRKPRINAAGKKIKRYSKGQYKEITDLLDGLSPTASDADRKACFTNQQVNRLIRSGSGTLNDPNAPSIKEITISL